MASPAWTRRARLYSGGGEIEDAPVAAAAAVGGCRGGGEQPAPRGGEGARSPAHHGRRRGSVTAAGGGGGGSVRNTGRRNSRRQLLQTSARGPRNPFLVLVFVMTSLSSLVLGLFLKHRRPRVLVSNESMLFAMFTVVCIASGAVIVLYTTQLNYQRLRVKTLRRDSWTEEFVSRVEKGEDPYVLGDNGTIPPHVTFILMGDPQEPHTAWHTLQEFRKKQIKKVCEHYKGGREVRETIVPEYLRDSVVDIQDKIMFCPSLLDSSQKIHTWVSALALAAKESLRLDTTDRISGLKERKKVKYEMNQIVTGMAMMEAMNTDPLIKRDRWMEKFTKILFVEHPFEKLVSAYEDKFRKRKGFLGYLVGKRVLTFTRGHAGTVNVSRKIMEESPVRFREMISFILNRNIWDPHWKSVYEVCHPCNLNYDYVIKVDTFANDVRNLFKVLYEPSRRAEIIQEFPGLRRKTDEMVSLTLNKHYKAINASELLILYDLFDMDMFMFKYQWPFNRLTADTK